MSQKKNLSLDGAVYIEVQMRCIFSMLHKFKFQICTNKLYAFFYLYNKKLIF